MDRSGLIRICTGDGICSEIAPDVFYGESTGLWHVKEEAKHFGETKYFAKSKGNPEGGQGLARIPEGQMDIVIEAAEDCPGECIFITEVSDNA